MQAVDTHAHLDHIENLPAVMEQARQAGVTDIMAVSVDLASMKRNVVIGRETENPRVYLALGIHPGNIADDEFAESMQFVRDHIAEAHAIGEIGLDFWYKWVRKDEEKKRGQREVFSRQLMLAREYDKPVIVHTRGTWRECCNTVRLAGIRRAVFHWYSGPVDVLKDILDAGYFVSCSPSLASSPQSREAIRCAPIEQTLIETDSPVFYRYRDREGGFTAGPADVFKTLKAYADLKGVEPEKALEVLNRNAGKLFGIPDICMRSENRGA